MKVSYLNTVFFSFIFILFSIFPTILSKSETYTTSSSDHLDDYYQVIIDNNIFHPLGWQAPIVSFPYQLIGTIIGTKDLTAIIQEMTSKHKIHFVTIGNMLENMTVINIQPKRVILDKDGKQIILSMTPLFLNLPNVVRTAQDRIPAQRSSRAVQSINQRVSSKRQMDMRPRNPVVYQVF